MPLQALLRRAGLWNPLVSLNQSLRRLLRLSPQPHTELLVHLDTGRAALLQFDAQNQCTIPLVLPHVRVQIHSLSVQNDGTLYFNDTDRGTIVHFDLNTRQELSRIVVPGKFLRGLTHLDSGLAIVGTQNYLYTINLREKQVLNRTEISSTVTEAIYDIKVLPPTFTALPERLERSA